MFVTDGDGISGYDKVSDYKCLSLMMLVVMMRLVTVMFVAGDDVSGYDEISD